MAEEFGYSHYSGCGNTFFIFNDLDARFPYERTNLIRQLCQTSSDNSVDGIIFLNRSSTADFAMRIFNSDGSEAEMCGNGIRCLMHFIRKEGYELRQARIQTKERILDVAFEGEEVCVNMGTPIDWKTHIELDYKQFPFTLHYVNTGVPHIVTFVNNLEGYPVREVGKYFRYHPHFSDKGANVNFVQIIEDATHYDIKVRTYERGVEDETPACGTGATASALIAATLYTINSPIRVKVASNDILHISYSIKDGLISSAQMKGPVQWISDSSCLIQDYDYDMALTS